MGTTNILCQTFQSRFQYILKAMHLIFTTKSLIQQLKNYGWSKLLEGRSRQPNIIVEYHYQLDIFLVREILLRHYMLDIPYHENLQNITILLNCAKTS
ncbi:hypothetical protein CR513_27718, partial [Mucuna pruriens]